MSKKHKRKVSRIIILTTDAVDAKTKQVKIRPWLAGFITLIVCIVLGGAIGLFVYESQIWELANKKNAAQAEEMAALEQEIDRLKAEIETLTQEKEAMSVAVVENQQTADALAAELEQQSVPTDYPLTGSAGVEEVTEGDPMVVFTASDKATVVASAKGTVTEVKQDETYGNVIVVDHGNGYVSIYKNKGEAHVKVGDEVAPGTTLFIIGEENKQLGYQIMKDGAYINPTDILSING